MCCLPRDLKPSAMPTALCPAVTTRCPLWVTGGPLPSEETPRQRPFLIHPYIPATPPPAVSLTESSSRPPSHSPWRESGWGGEVVTRPEGAWTMVNKRVKPRIHHIQLIPDAKDTTPSETEPNKGVWLAADNWKSGPEVFGPTQESILFLTGKKSRRLAILDSLCGLGILGHPTSVSEALPVAPERPRHLMALD